MPVFTHRLMCIQGPL